MATLTRAEMELVALKRSNSYATVDAPFVAADITSALNEAYSVFWERGGGAAKRALHTTAWIEASDDGTGIVTGKIQDIGEILRVWHAALNTSLGRTNGDRELVKVDPSRVNYLRSEAGLAAASVGPATVGVVGKYAKPKIYCAYRKDAGGVAAADVNEFSLEVWPALAGAFYPIEYVPQFVPLTDAGTDCPNVTDIESYDMGLWAAATLAPLSGSADLVPSILASISESGQAALERKISAMLQAKQDR